MVPNAYDNDPKVKAALVAQLEAHAAADEIVKGRYWDDGKGCAVGCTIHGSNHARYDDIFGPGGHMLAWIEDEIFEGASNARARRFPLEFVRAVRPGADLSRVGWQFLSWCLMDVSMNPGIANPQVSEAVAQCAAVVAALARGERVDGEVARSAAAAAAKYAPGAWYADVAADVVAKYAARAWYAVASAAAGTAESAVYAGYAIGRVTNARAGYADESVAYDLMADKLVELLAAA